MPIYMNDLDPCDVDIDHSDIVESSLDVSFSPEVVSSPEVIAKLEDAKLQKDLSLKKYEVEGLFNKTTTEFFNEGVVANSSEDAKSKVEEILNSKNEGHYVSRVSFTEIREVA